MIENIKTILKDILPLITTALMHQTAVAVMPIAVATISHKKKPPMVATFSGKNAWKTAPNREEAARDKNKIKKSLLNKALSDFFHQNK